MGRSRNGEHRHRQPWREVECPACGQTVKARPGRPDQPWHIAAHVTLAADHAVGICYGVVAEAASQH